MLRRNAAFAVVVAAIGAAPLAHADGRFGPNDVRTIFVIGKNTDKNEVQFGVRLDAECVPVGNEPIYAYWRQFEKGPDVTEDLNFLDKTGYGIKSQSIESKGPDGSRIILRLRATSDRLIAIQTRKDGKGGCAAEALSNISSTPARLKRIHVQLTGPISIAYIEISGNKLDDNAPIVERAKP